MIYRDNYGRLVIDSNGETIDYYDSVQPFYKNAVTCKCPCRSHPELIIGSLGCTAECPNCHTHVTLENSFDIKKLTKLWNEKMEGFNYI